MVGGGGKGRKGQGGQYISTASMVEMFCILDNEILTGDPDPVEPTELRRMDGCMEC